MPAQFSQKPLTSTLPLQVADQIGTAIVDEQLSPGERIREVVLAQTFNVSRATIRDALRILETRGLVRILPQRGAQVTFLSPTELRNLFEIRAVLLALAARHAAANYTPAYREQFEYTLATLKETLNDPIGYARASATMVAQVASLSGNEQLAEMIESFAQRIGRYVRLGLATRERRCRSLENWQSLVTAIFEHNQDAAEAIHRNLATENGKAAMVAIQAHQKGSKRQEGCR